MKLTAYLEGTRRRTFACAVDWPGWCRAGKTEDDVLDALVEYGARYKKALGRRAVNLTLPNSRHDVEVVERLKGNATTEFGAPGVIPPGDRGPVSDARLKELLDVLTAAWTAFDESVETARGKALAAGPRGGGRSLEKIAEHVAGADVSYVRAIGGTIDEGAEWPAVQNAFRHAVVARAHGELPEKGPRGGDRWPARYAIRRSAWHALDHAWEIEDRLS